MLNRRGFLQSGSAALAARLFAAAPGSSHPHAELENLGAVALREAKRLKATYCDIRIIRYRRQRLSIRLNPERGTGKTLEVPNVSDGGSFGFGVRVIAGGAWGFAASPVVTKDEIARITREAIAVARANAVLQSRPIRLAPVKAYRERWQTPHDRDPFAVPIEEKLDLIRKAAAEVKSGKGVFSSGCDLSFRSEDKYFASSEGSSLQQLNLQTYAEVDGAAVDLKRALSKNRRYKAPQATAGYEYVAIMNLVENARRIREEVVEHLNAPAVEPGPKDLGCCRAIFGSPYTRAWAIPPSWTARWATRPTTPAPVSLRRTSSGKSASEATSSRSGGIGPMSAASPPLATTTTASGPPGFRLSSEGFSSTTRPSATRRTWWAKPNPAAAATPIAGPACRSSACPTYGWSRARRRLRSKI
jgi:hypothetical protein